MTLQITNQMTDTLSNIAKATQSAQSAFIERDDTINMIATCTVAGKHGLLLGKPGTTKSALISGLSETTGLQFRKVLMNPDITRDEILGSIDPTAFANGKWDRVWASLAVADLAFVDEVGKATGANLNILLNLMEEREVIIGGIAQPVPLLSLFGASNEIFSGTSPAVWDRFLCRVHVKSVTNDNFQAMLTADIDDLGNFPVDRDSLVNLAKLSKQMARNSSKDVLDTMLSLRINLPSITTAYVSDRRWRQILELAGGNALLSGRDSIEPADLMVAKWCVWDVPKNGDIASEIANIGNFIGALTDTAKQELASYTKKVDDLFDESKRLLPDGTQLTSMTDDIVRLNMKIDATVKDITGRKGQSWGELRSRLQAAKNRVIEAL